MSSTAAYKDYACTQKFQEDGEVLTANTNLYGRWTRLGTKIVTFKVQNGTWSDHLSADKNVTVDLRNGFGTLSENDVPTGMIPDGGYQAPARGTAARTRTPTASVRRETMSIPIPSLRRTNAR
ncbi:MAG: hypothetical protein ACLS3C_03525 [Oscillospiraceae bacterium]